MVEKISLFVGSVLVFFLTCQSISGQEIKPNLSFSIEFSEAVPKEGDKIIIKAKVYNHTEKAIENILIQFFDGNSEKGQKIGEQLIPEISERDKAEILVNWIPIKNGLHCIYGVAKSGKDKAVAFKEISVVAKNLYFVWWPGEKEINDKLKYANVSLANKETVSYWKAKGVIPCLWKSASKGKSADEYAQYLSKDVSEIGAEGIMLDEIGWYEKTPQEEEGLKGLEKFTKEHPEIFTAVYISGSLKPEQCNLTKNPYRKQGIDLLMLESYFNYQVPDFNSYSRYKYFNQRIEMARDYDVLASSIMILGINDRPDIYTITPTITPEDLESQFIYIRRNAPEMPGIGFYKVTNKEISLLADRLCYKYFIAPVVTTWDRDIIFSDFHPVGSQKITIYANIYNIGGMDAKDITVKFYCGNPEERGKEIGKVVIPVLSPKEGVPSGITKVSTQWKATKGYHHIYVEITSKDSNVTILEGQTKRLIFVR